MNPFREDGHLHDLALEDVLDDEPGPGATAHLDVCGPCRERLEAADRVPGVAPPQPKPANRPHWSWIVAGLVAAVVVVTALAVGRLPQGDGIQVRGGGVVLRVYRDEGERSRRLRDGAEVRGGDHLGFTVEHRKGGHLMVLGIDARLAPYVCYPQGQDGRSEPVGPASTAEALPEAIEMDDTPGAERLIALLCAAPFELQEVVSELEQGRVPEGCRADEVTLVKP